MYPHHLLLPLFPLLLPLTLAVPAPAPTTTSASFPCASVAGDWQIFDLESFTAARGTNGVSNIDFNVIDGSTFLSPVIANCNRTLPAGQTVFDPYHFYPCEERNPEGVGLQFKYTNTSLSFRQRCTANDG